MNPYKNLSGQSNVSAYAHTADSFTVRFMDNSHYLYSTAKNRLSEIQKMITLAVAGKGLGTMLATKPYHPHDRKW